MKNAALSVVSTRHENFFLPRIFTPTDRNCNQIIGQAMNKQIRKLIVGVCVVAASVLTQLAVQAAPPEAPRVTRLANGPIIVPDMDSRMGSNIQGPSLIRVPDWIENPLGKYYLYFADHRGSYIRLAYADELTGPWKMHESGSMTLEDSFFPTTCPPCSLAPGASGALYAHIASPDVHVDHDRQKIIMYIHGRDVGQQLTRMALSSGGLHFQGRPDVLGRPYFRVIQHKGTHLCQGFDVTVIHDGIHPSSMNRNQASSDSGNTVPVQYHPVLEEAESIQAIKLSVQFPFCRWW